LILRTMRIALASLLCILSSSGVARAEMGVVNDTDSARVRLEPAAFMPIGDLSTGAGPSVGGFVGFQHRVIPALAITARAGYLAGSEKEVSLGPTTPPHSTEPAPVPRRREGVLPRQARSRPVRGR
jgi:hypothetical protein